MHGHVMVKQAEKQEKSEQEKKQATRFFKKQTACGNEKKK